MYNNGGSLEAVISSIEDVLAPYDQLDFEIIFVNDGSTDNSLQLIKEFRRSDKRVKYISFSGNFGQVPALVAGLKHCTGDAAVLRSADQQDTFELIPQFIDAWQDGHMIVIGHRIQNRDTLDQRLPSGIFYRIMNWINPEIPKGGYDYGLLDRVVIDLIMSFGDKHRFLQTDILSLGYTPKLIPYTRETDNSKGRKRGLGIRVKYLVDGVLNTSNLPIRSMTYVGFGFAAIGVIYSITIVIARITNKVPFIGWAPLMILLLVIGGMIMIMLGIIGEYLWRIYDEIKKRPEYVIREMALDDE